jgi:uncharacterized RDD family membrane protein YckC
MPLSNSSHSADVAENADTLPGWKQEASARLSAHRMRRGAFSGKQPALPGMEPAAPPVPAERAASVAARVAERYSKTPTYGEMLAAEATRAARAAEAAAQAAREAQEAAQAVTEVLRAGIESATEVEQPAETAPTSAPRQPQYHIDPASLPTAQRSQPFPQNVKSPSVDPHPHVVDPLEEALVAPAQPLPARVLEFPRELVAPRRARPRIAEGPLRDSEANPEKEQIRIFEVEPETISHQPSPVQAGIDDVVLPGWSSIRLDATPRNIEEEMSATIEKSRRAAQGRSGNHSALLSSRAARPSASKNRATRGNALLDDTLHVAPILDRLLAAVVDIGLIVCAFSAFVGVFIACTAHPPTGKPALIAAAAVLVGFIALYQWLFFTYAENTPGMRFAKIALCTFDDQNPGRKTLQHRVGALFLAALPMGLGFLWVLLDDDRLGWHDRMTRTYQRSYK